MVVIRLSRGGRKKRPFYHITVADSRSKRDGKRDRVRSYIVPFIPKIPRGQLHSFSPVLTLTPQQPKTPIKQA